MNIFWINSNPRLAARDHIDKHVIKMILETAQLLSIAHRVLDKHNKSNSNYLKITHKNHPCAVWVRKSSSNYEWTFELFRGLYVEKIKRYGGGHVTFEDYSDILEKLPKNIPIKGLTAPAQAMPDQYKNKDPVVAYRQFYIGEKYKFASWKNKEPPSWFI